MSDGAGYQLISGMIVAGYAVVALLFLRSWRETGDRLFPIFSAAFGLLAVQRLALASTSDAEEVPLLLYFVRLAAYLLIVYAIVDKNREKRR